MAADVEEGPESVVVSTDYDDGFAGDVGGEELAGGADLVEAAEDLPGAGEDAGTLEGFDLWVAVPGGGDGVGAVERIGGIVEGEEVVDGGWHGRILARKMEIGKWKLGGGRTSPRPGRGCKKQIPRFARYDRFFSFWSTKLNE